MTCLIIIVLHWLAADKACGDVQPESGWIEHDDLSVAVSSLQVEARGATSTQD